VNPVFVSGWAGCECLYPGIAAAARYLVPFVRHSEAEIARVLDQGGTTLLGWSTGAHIILKRLPRLLDRFGRIVLAAPFLSFTRYVPKPRLEAMIAAMRTDPAKTVDSFMAKCGHCGPLSVEEADHSSLVRGLEFLLDSEAALPPGLTGERVTIVHGERDRIVPLAASLELHGLLPGSTLLTIPGGHKIPEQVLMDLIG
jgi:pimeloyl-ACP methyl ester carboxylesterase